MSRALDAVLMWRLFFSEHGREGMALAQLEVVAKRGGYMAHGFHLRGYAGAAYNSLQVTRAPERRRWALDMDDQFIYPHELVLLVVWLSSPPLLLGIGYHVFVARRVGLRRWVTTLAAAIFSVLALLGAALLWKLLPQSLLPGSVLPKSGALSFVPPFFPPSYLSAVCVATITSLLAVKAQQAVQPDRREDAAPG
jgi:hypothetical protein